MQSRMQSSFLLNLLNAQNSKLPFPLTWTPTSLNGKDAFTANFPDSISFDKYVDIVRLLRLNENCLNHHKYTNISISTDELMQSPLVLDHIAALELPYSELNSQGRKNALVAQLGNTTNHTEIITLQYLLGKTQTAIAMETEAKAQTSNNGFVMLQPAKNNRRTLVPDDQYTTPKSPSKFACIARLFSSCCNSDKNDEKRQPFIPKPSTHRMG